MDKRKILFQPCSEDGRFFLNKPEPSSKNIPQWYKDDGIYTDGETNQFAAFKKNSIGTYKLCVPVTDSMTSGYTITLSSDVAVINHDPEKYNPTFNWAVSWSPVDQRPVQALGQYPEPYGHHKDFYRWLTYWKVITPKGYSLLITHPMHRYDLPFTTMSGIVDTDGHNNFLAVPFFIRHGFEGIIEKDTPIMQIIPIKRDSWESDLVEYDKNYLQKSSNFYRTNLFRSYKKNIWSKKEYK